MTSVKEQIEEFAAAGVARQLAPIIKNPDRKDNVGALLFDVFYWQELKALADKQLETAWGALVSEGLLESDDSLRSTAAIGDTLVTESPHFSVLVKLSSPRAVPDKTAFFKAVAKASKLPVAKLEALWQASSKPSKPSLSKKVLEA